MGLQFQKVNLSEVKTWKRPMKWDGTRDVFEKMEVGEAFEFTPDDQKQLRVLRVMVSDYGAKTDKAFSIKKANGGNYILARTK